MAGQGNGSWKEGRNLHLLGPWRWWVWVKIKEWWENRRWEERESETGPGVQTLEVSRGALILPWGQWEAFQVFYQWGLGGGGWGGVWLQQRRAICFHFPCLVGSWERTTYFWRKWTSRNILTLPQNKNKVLNECKALESSRFMKKLSSMKPVSGTKHRLGNAALDDVLSETVTVNPHPINEWALGPLPHCDFTYIVKRTSKSLWDGETVPL